ncbi:MAG: CRTAC1 family protein [Chryseolinea sp.]
MVSILKDFRKKSANPHNEFHPKAKLVYTDSLLSVARSPGEIAYCNFLKAHVLLELGEEEKSIDIYNSLEKTVNRSQRELVWRDMAVANFRLAEQANCVANHASASCIFPIKGMGIHTDMVGSRKAIEVYETILKETPNDLESRWLLNLAYMTLGEYPKSVPPAYFLPGMEGDTTVKVKSFEDIAADLNIDVNNMAGGNIADDFDNDGYLDFVTSGMGIDEPMHYFKNNADGTFTNLSNKVGLEGITGGLNIMQTDYNNDGLKDIFVLRGAWKREFGNEPNSLLKNNGDGTFSDVTIESGLLSFHPTQTATWNDFNNDGWLDVFIGNEHSNSMNINPHPCELYMSNQDGTFREVGAKAQCTIMSYVKGVTSGDYNHDGLKDIFVSTMDGKRVLLKNGGVKENEIIFEDVTIEAGLANEKGRSFPTWFWDYDNDGWLDIFTCDYSFQKTLAYYAAAEKLGIPAGNPEKMLLYRNNHDGTFTNVANEMGLTKIVFAMGSNFGDIDNDGFLDMYLGTGNPNYESLVPNKMFKNIEGKKFADVTSSARVGHLQKGHGVSFADMDNDGDQDIYCEMGGAYPGDAYQSSFFLNPGQSNNNWINLQLEGTKSNRAAIGSQLKITFTENGISRSVYRDVNSGGSFGASPLRREIGIGGAAMIDEIEIHWHGSGEVQTFKNVKPNQFLKITEGKNQLEVINLKTINWILPNRLCLPGTTIPVNL